MKLPTPTGGYINLSDAAITFVAYSFGPITGMIAGGLGTALADALGGYMQYAPISLIVHGLEAFVLAMICRLATKDMGKGRSLMIRILAGVAAMLIVAGGYWLLAGGFLIGFGPAATEIPANLIQGGVGAVFGLVISEAVRACYRKIDDIRW